MVDDPGAVARVGTTGEVGDVIQAAADPVHGRAGGRGRFPHRGLAHVPMAREPAYSICPHWSWRGDVAPPPDPRRLAAVG